MTANGLRFAFLEGGSGPLVMLLHGWPDTPHTWDHQLTALAAAGFRVVAPWLRGYPPTEIPRPGYFDIGTLATDVRELIGVLGGGDPCLLLGQDWGASIGYQVPAAFPEGESGKQPAHSSPGTPDRLGSYSMLPDSYGGTIKCNTDVGPRPSPI